MSEFPLRMRSLRWAVNGGQLAVLALVLGGCGGGGGGDDEPGGGVVGGGSGGGGTTGALWTEPPAPPADPGPGAVVTGVFRDAVVEGLEFESGSQTGVTGPDGVFRYENGTTVTFRIGSLVYGDGTGLPLMSPMNLLTPGGDLVQEIRNRARFLQALDLDGDPDNGITLSAQVRAAAASWPQVDFSALDFPAQVQQHLDEAGAADGRTRVLPGEEAANDHFVNSIRCEYSGLYRGTFAGNDSGVFAVSVDRGGRIQGQAYSNIEREGFFVRSAGNLALSLLPPFTASEDDGPGVYSGRFVSPDQMEGTWRSEEDTGTFVGRRSGGSNRAMFRFADFTFPLGTALVFNIEINADNTVTGSIIDLDRAANGVPVQVTGTLSGDAVSMSSAGNEYSLSATFDRSDPANYRLNGTLTDRRKSREVGFTPFGCRLN